MIMWACIVKRPCPLGGVISTSVVLGVVDMTVLIGLPDHSDRLSIRHHRHVLFDPALRRGLRAAQASPALAEIILLEGGW